MRADGGWGYWGFGILVASKGAPTPLCLFPVAQRCLHYGWPLCSANSPHIVSFCLFKIICLFIIILARSLLPLVLPVTLQWEFQSLHAFKLPRSFSPLIAFLKSISFRRTFMSYPSWKWKGVLDITKKDVILGQDPLVQRAPWALLHWGRCRYPWVHDVLCRVFSLIY